MKDSIFSCLSHFVMISNMVVWVSSQLVGKGPVSSTAGCLEIKENLFNFILQFINHATCCCQAVTAVNDL